MKKILFNDKHCLTQAVLAGTKTMTRRVLRDNVPLGNWGETVKHLPYKVGEVVATKGKMNNIPVRWQKIFPTPREAFAALIDKISGKGTWENNPWVVAYSFELVD